MVMLISHIDSHMLIGVWTQEGIINKFTDLNMKTNGLDT